MTVVEYQQQRYYTNTMNVQVCILLSGLAVLQCVAQKSGPESDFYSAAVVEYAPFEIRAGEDPLLVTRKNALNHMYYMEQASRKGADIVVFPECGLTGINLPTSRKELRPYLTEIPDPKHKPNPCVDATGNASQLLKDLSCASQRYQIYSVMNLPEMAPCTAQDGGGNTSCPDDGVFIYNTNIVFDRSGVIVARYRKYNLFLEPGFDIEPTAAHATFDTDFGVRFGMFICFDILFRQPAVAMVTEQNITDIVYSTAWFSELPFLTAVQTQAAWSYATDTNFLAAGYNKPANMNTGSGIYAGRDGVMTSVMAFEKLNQMLVAKVRKKRRSNTSETATTPHVTRTKRDDNEGDREVSFVKNEESETSVQSSMLNEEPSGVSLFRSPLKQILDDEKCGQKSYAIQYSREYENNKGRSGQKNIVKRNVVLEDTVDTSTETVPSVKTHRTFGAELHLFNTALLNVTNVDDKNNHSESLFLCHLSVCCNFKLTTNTRVESNSVDREFYRAGVFDGSGLEDSYQTCLIMRCSSPDLDSCGDGIDHPKAQTSATIFTEVKIDGHFKKGGKINAGYNNSVHINDDIGVDRQHLIMSNNQEIKILSIFSAYVDGFPKEPSSNLLQYGHLNLFQDDLSQYNTLLVGSQNVNKQLNLCNGNLCCQFYIGAETEINSTYEDIPVNNSAISSNNGYYFRIGVFEGTRDFVLTIKAGLQVCALFACTTDNVTTCGLLKNETKSHVGNEIDVPQTTQTTSSDMVVGINEDESTSLSQTLVLKRVEIKGYFEKDNLIMPDTVTTKLLPLKSSDFEFTSDIEQRSHIDKSRTFVAMKANGAALDDLLTFGIYARDFRKDFA